jgi:hypothetical protein
MTVNATSLQPIHCDHDPNVAFAEGDRWCADNPGGDFKVVDAENPERMIPRSCLTGR